MPAYRSVARGIPFPSRTNGILRDIEQFPCATWQAADSRDRRQPAVPSSVSFIEPFENRSTAHQAASRAFNNAGPRLFSAPPTAFFADAGRCAELPLACVQGWWCSRLTSATLSPRFFYTPAQACKMSKNITWESVVYPDGATYQGLMKDGSCHYRGVFTYKDGDRYEGEYRDNMMTGSGVYYWKDTDSTFYGQWKNNNMHGCGVKVYPDDVIEEGEWLEDAFVGDFMACPADEAKRAAEEARRISARARLFENKPEGDVPPSDSHDINPVVYRAGEEYMAPGPVGARFPVPTSGAAALAEGERQLAEIQDRYIEVDGQPADAYREKQGIVLAQHSPHAGASSAGTAPVSVFASMSSAAQMAMQQAFKRAAQAVNRLGQPDLKPHPPQKAAPSGPSGLAKPGKGPAAFASMSLAIGLPSFAPRS
eukprot:jgi/Mesvir1/13408/Mv16493-RA.1